MFKSYAKGYRAEWSLTHALAERGFMAMRAPRSGRIGLASPDVIAAKKGRLLVIECKSREGAFTVEADQLDQLKQWEEKAGAMAYVGWKISREGWFFMRLADVAANNGNIGKKFATEKAITFDKLCEV
jgi:Holliday junction resolvase